MFFPGQRGFGAVLRLASIAQVRPHQAFPEFAVVGNVEVDGPADGLGVFEGAGLDGFVLFGCGLRFHLQWDFLGANSEGRI